MTRLEKLMVNRKRKGEKNAERLKKCLESLDTHRMKDVLELGCGIGAVSAFLAENYQMNVIGTDADPEQIELARRLYVEGTRLRFQVEDASNLTFEDDRFDLVVSQNVFHHIPDWQTAIVEVARVMRTEGYFIWYDLASPKALKGVLQFLLRSAGVYSVEDLNAAFQERGLSISAYEKLAHGPLGHHRFILQKSGAKSAIA